MFVDSPLSVNATSVLRRFSDCYNDTLKAYKLEDPDPFGFDQLFYLTEREDSMRLNHLKGPAVILSSSGMAEAGRIKHHLANHIGNPQNTVLIVGYCEPNSLGGRLAAGDKVVSIHGKRHKVKAMVTSLEEYSAHAGQSELLRYLHGQSQTCKTVFLVHGEYDKQLIFKSKLEQVGFQKVLIPELGESVYLE
jgi:metallo-beta-lactamase family protein